MAKLATATDGYSGSDLRELCRVAATRALRHSIKSHHRRQARAGSEGNAEDQVCCWEWWNCGGLGVGGGDGAAKQAQTHSHGTERGGEDRQTQTQTQTLTHSLCARFKGVSMRALAMRDFVSARRTVESALTDATVAPAVAAEGVRSLD